MFDWKSTNEQKQTFDVQNKFRTSVLKLTVLPVQAIILTNRSIKRLNQLSILKSIFFWYQIDEFPTQVRVANGDTLKIVTLYIIFNKTLYGRVPSFRLHYYQPVRSAYTRACNVAYCSFHIKLAACCVLSGGRLATNVPTTPRFPQFRVPRG